MSQYDQNLRIAVADLNEKGIFANKVIIFGTGKNAKRLFSELVDQNLTIDGVIDNNSSVVGQKFFEKEVQYAPDFLENGFKGYVYLVLSNFYDEIKNQLIQNGYVENKDFFPVMKLESNVYCWKEKRECDDLVDKISRGWQLENFLIEKYGSEKEFFVNPVTSIGDVFLLSPVYMEYRNYDQSYMVVGSKVQYEIAKNYKVDNVICLSKDEIECLIAYGKTFDFEKTNIRLLHTGYVHYNLTSRMLTKRGLTWQEHYYEIFKLDKNFTPMYLKFNYNQENVNELFYRNKLEKGKTVILSPYANAVRQLPLRMWEELAIRLKEIGYSVCTNIGNASEIAIKGTVGVRADLPDFQRFVEQAGFFIGTRSGLCDTIINNSAMRIILYSDEIFDMISVFDFYSLAKMGDMGYLKEFIISDEEKNITYIAKELENKK